MRVEVQPGETVEIVGVARAATAPTSYDLAPCWPVFHRLSPGTETIVCWAFSEGWAKTIATNLGPDVYMGEAR